MQKTSIRFKSQLSGIASLSEHYQGSTIGVRRVCTYAYFYWRTHKFGHSYVDTYAHFFRMIFSSFQNFSGSYNFILLKNLLLDLFVPEKNRFFTACICFKETLFSNFSYKLFTSEHLPI